MLQSRARWSFPSNMAEEITDTKDIVLRLLAERGIQTEEEIARFLSPSLEHLQSPSAFAMIDKAVERIKKAISEGENILIYGDYDADGVCSTALMLKAITELEGKCDYYIPNRFEEGYGLHKEAIDYAKSIDIDLMITVDTGIASFEEVDYANSLGIDVIITDHHDIQGDYPNAYAVIHPELSPDYKFKHLAGVGIAFKLAEHLLGYFPKHLLDLVAIGTIADLVPLIDENRILAHFGLKQLMNTDNIGLIALKKQCYINGVLTEEDVGFRIGPRLNAVGRLTSADLAVELLMCNDENAAEEMVKEIESLNSERQKLVADIAKEAEEQLQSLGDREVIFLANENWHEGVLGIVASRLAKKYYRPTIICKLDPETNTLKGSARSIPSFHMFNHCMEVRDLFISFGGHSQAAGMTLSVEHKDEIIAHLNEKVSQLSVEDLQESIIISQSLTVNQLSKHFIEQIEKFAPFGMENPKPLFHIKAIPREITQIGRDKNHLKIHYNRESEKFEAIGFNLGHLYYQIAPETPVSIVGELGMNEWNGYENLQMIIEDIGVDEWQLFDHRGKVNVNLTDYIIDLDSCLFIAEEKNDFESFKPLYTYEEGLQTTKKINQLFLLDFPKRLKDLKRLVSKLKPNQIHLCFMQKGGFYLQTFPTREEFAWLYRYINIKNPFNIKDKIPEIMQQKKWSKERVIFMFHVFHDLNFIQSTNGIITLLNNPDKRNLEDSIVYQQQKEQIEIEKLLHYSTYNHLKQLFTQWVSEVAEEEVNNGF